MAQIAINTSTVFNPSLWSKQIWPLICLQVQTWCKYDVSTSDTFACCFCSNTCSWIYACSVGSFPATSAVPSCCHWLSTGGFQCRHRSHRPKRPAPNLRGMKTSSRRRVGWDVLWRDTGTSTGACARTTSAPTACADRESALTSSTLALFAPASSSNAGSPWLSLLAVMLLLDAQL